MVRAAKGKARHVTLMELVHDGAAKHVWVFYFVTATVVTVDVSSISFLNQWNGS